MVKQQQSVNTHVDEVLKSGRFLPATGSAGLILVLLGGSVDCLFVVEGAGLGFALQGLDVVFASHPDAQPRLEAGS